VDRQPRPKINGATLTLEDGATYNGESFGAAVPTSGEVVFSTGMVGYPEMLTDPSFRGQILAFTYPLIGNYGIPAMRRDEFGLPVGFEAARIHVSGVIVSEHCLDYSHRTAVMSLDEWLRAEGIPGISGIDTRALTKRLRARGTMLGKLEPPGTNTGISDPNAMNLAATVSVREVAQYTGAGPGRHPLVVLVDCGVKANIIRCLLKRGMDVRVVPHDHYFLNDEFDGVVVSNGPGDPKMCTATVRNVARALATGRPMLGICLGNQIMALAAGADTYKLKYGHRGQNQPCIEVPDPRVGGPRRGLCVLTSQNHGYSVRADTLPSDWRVWFTNANDGTVEGIAHVSRPYFAVQFHPEASPGPLDTGWVFDRFARLVKGGK